MRIWLDPNKLAALDITASDVVQAIQEQNKQVAAGVVGQEPAPKGTQFQVAVNTQGRLVEPAEFSRIVIKRGEKGEVIRLSEVGTVDLGAKNYAAGLRMVIFTALNLLADLGEPGLATDIARVVDHCGLLIEELNKTAA